MFLGDEQLYDLEYELSNSDHARQFMETLMDQYRQWKSEVGPEKWGEQELYPRRVGHGLTGAGLRAISMAT